MIVRVCVERERKGRFSSLGQWVSVFMSVRVYQERRKRRRSITGMHHTHTHTHTHTPTCGGATKKPKAVCAMVAAKTIDDNDSRRGVILLVCVCVCVCVCMSMEIEKISARRER